MLIASSQPYFSLYRPWAWTQEHVVATEGGHFILPASELEDLPYPPAVEVTHEADIKIIGFQKMEYHEQIGIYPPEGFTSWLILTEWEAPTDSLLANCNMWFSGSDGRRYYRTNSVFSGEMDENLHASTSCTPPGEAGPKHVWDTGEIVTEEPRPEQWRKLAPVAMPDGVQPTKLHFAWGQPHYVTIVLPEPAEFIDASSAGAAGE